MYITFYSPISDVSGGTIVMYKYAQALVERGHNVTIISPSVNPSKQNVNGINVISFKKRKYRGFFSFQLYYILDFIKNTPKSDIIIPIFFPLVIHALLAKKFNKCDKVIPLFQDHKSMTYGYGKYIYTLLSLKVITKQLDNIFAVSTPTAKEIKDTSGLDPIILPNGIEHEYFYKRDVEKENYLLFVASGLKSKGFDYFLKAFKLVQQKYPDIKAKVITQRAIDEKINNVDFVLYNGDRNKLGEYYSKALIFVSQSLGDSFGLPPLEAMASGTATVVTDTVGIHEYGVNMVNTVIVPIKNPKATADAIIKIIEDVGLRKEIEKNSIKTAGQYKWNDSINTFINVIENS